MKDINFIVDENSTPAMIAEVKSLLAAPLETAIADERLFQLFVQRQELSILTHDFRDSELLFGPADSSDIFNWTNFGVEEWEDITNIQDAMKAADAKALLIANKAAGISGAPKVKSWMKKEIIIPGEDGKCVAADIKRITCKRQDLVQFSVIFLPYFFYGYGNECDGYAYLFTSTIPD